MCGMMEGCRRPVRPAGYVGARQLPRQWFEEVFWRVRFFVSIKRLQRWWSVSKMSERIASVGDLKVLRMSDGNESSR